MGHPSTSTFIDYVFVTDMLSSGDPSRSGLQTRVKDVEFVTDLPTMDFLLPTIFLDESRTSYG